MSYLDELPSGWVRQYDEQAQHPFWVDTRANPPRPIWVHPYEDEQYLSEHPEHRGKAKRAASEESDLPPPYSPRRHSYSGPSSSGPSSISTPSGDRPTTSQPPTPGPSSGAVNKQRGFFGKLKDKAIGTKEEREEARRQEALYMQRLAQEERKLAEEQRKRRQERLASMGGARYSQSMYGPPPGRPFAPYGCGSGYGRMSGMSGMGRIGGYGGGYGRSGFGGGGVGLPLLGGMAGGLLLADMLDGPGFGGGFDGGFDNSFGGGF
ncbi:hypothetical protein K474DRAFT_1658335 [Panus rudis PR-1116 ss-1]|nr:hypothetical protein K474DRAFT_1658335 [Panus rudis PR-1116 ss-1]